MKEHQGGGVGRRLLQASIDRLAADGFKGMMLWVLADNPTCDFYARMGGKVVGEKIETIGGKSLKELAYGWAALPVADSGSGSGLSGMVRPLDR
jgi:L-amino acid N-acyltransferase YncA